MSDSYVLVEIERVAADHGTIVEFIGWTEDGRPATVAADHRPAQLIIRALEDGSDAPVVVQCEPWQMATGHHFG